MVRMAGRLPLSAGKSSWREPVWSAPRRGRWAASLRQLGVTAAAQGLTGSLLCLRMRDHRGMVGSQSPQERLRASCALVEARCCGEMRPEQEFLARPRIGG